MIIWSQCYILLGTFFALLVTIFAWKVEPDHKGTRFVIGFVENNSTLPPEIVVIPQQETEVNVTVTIPLDSTFQQIFNTVRDQDVIEIKLPMEARMPTDSVGSKGIELKATSDIVVYGVNRANGSSDAFLALPVDALGRDYIIASYKETGDFISQAGIVATQPNTTVFIQIPDFENSLYYDVKVGKHTMSGQKGFNVTLDAFQTIQLESRSDLTGIHISSNKPLTVISGSTASWNASDSEFLSDHFSEQLSPTRSWGRSFATVPFSIGKTEDVFQIVAKHNDTTIYIKQKIINDSKRLSESEHVQVNVAKGDYISIEADKPVLVLQYVVPHLLKGKEDCKSNCGSFMLMVPPMEQQEDQYLFSTLTAGGKQNVNLVITSNLTDGVLLDGMDILESANISDSGLLPNWTVINPDSDMNYSAIQFSVDGGLHNLSHYFSDALFLATSYGYPLGMRLLDLPSVTNIAPYHIQPNNGTNGILVQTPENNSDNSDSSGGKQEKSSVIDEGLKRSTIAVIVSLCSGVFFVIVCIVGFIIAEFVCNSKEPLFGRGKVAPFKN